MRLGIDIDGVLADFNAGWMARYNEDYGTSLTPDAVQAWGRLHELTHFPDMRAFWRWAEGGDRASIFRHSEMYAGAHEALVRLSRDHSIVILTRKPTWAVPDTFAWIAEHEIPTREVHILKSKWTVSCDVYLDDAPHNLARLRRHRPEATVCRFVRPWNEPVEGTVDVADWPEFVSLIDSL